MFDFIWGHFFKRWKAISPKPLLSGKTNKGDIFSAFYYSLTRVGCEDWYLNTDDWFTSILAALTNQTPTDVKHRHRQAFHYIQISTQQHIFINSCTTRRHILVYFATNLTDDWFVELKAWHLFWDSLRFVGIQRKMGTKLDFYLEIFVNVCLHTAIL